MKTMKFLGIPARLSLLILAALVIGWYWRRHNGVKPSRPTSDLAVVSHLHVVDPDSPHLDRNFPCIKTKKVLDLYESTICVHAKGDTVSGDVTSSRIWEETDMTRLLRILIRNPQMDMIDIGANIGGYTMFTAGALGRFTLAVDCYLPNIERIARAVQIQRVQNRVVLVQNAIFESSGKSLTLTMDDPSGIRLINGTYKASKASQFVVQSIRFDDLLPILLRRRVRTALMKIDIETSESYMCATGAKVFQQIDIPFVMMEWHSWRVNHQARYQSIVDFFTERDYLPTNERCQVIQTATWLTDWPGNVFWIKKVYMNQTFC